MVVHNEKPGGQRGQRPNQKASLDRRLQILERQLHLLTRLYHAYTKEFFGPKPLGKTTGKPTNQPDDTSKST